MDRMRKTDFAAETEFISVGPDEVTFDDVRRGRESNPVDGDKGYKTFARDIGIILD